MAMLRHGQAPHRTRQHPEGLIERSLPRLHHAVGKRRGVPAATEVAKGFWVGGRYSHELQVCVCAPTSPLGVVTWGPIPTGNPPGSGQARDEIFPGGSHFGWHGCARHTQMPMSRGPEMVVFERKFAGSTGSGTQTAKMPAMGRAPYHNPPPAPGLVQAA